MSDRRRGRRTHDGGPFDGCLIELIVGLLILAAAVLTALLS